MAKCIKVFSISRFYRTCTVYIADSNGEVQGRFTISFDKGVKITERYQQIAKFIERQGLKCPAYETMRRR